MHAWPDRFFSRIPLKNNLPSTFAILVPSASVSPILTPTKCFRRNLQGKNKVVVFLAHTKQQKQQQRRSLAQLQPDPRSACRVFLVVLSPHFALLGLIWRRRTVEASRTHAQTHTGCAGCHLTHRCDSFGILLHIYTLRWKNDFHSHNQGQHKADHKGCLRFV